MDAGIVATALVGWVAGVGTTTAGLLVKYRLDVARDRRKVRVSERERQRRTDRATCADRVACLVLCNLAAYVHSGRWRRDDTGLEQLLARLENGSYPVFLDSRVERAWVELVEMTVVLARRRLAGGNLPVVPEDLQYLVELRREWEHAAKSSFGPLPELGQPDAPRAGQESAEELFAAA